MANSEFLEILSPNALEQLKQAEFLVKKLADDIKTINNFKSATTPSGSDEKIKQLNIAYKEQTIALKLLKQELDNATNSHIKYNNQKISDIRLSETERKATLAQEQAEKKLTAEKQRALAASERLNSAYNKLNKARSDAKNHLRDLIASERASTAEINKAQKAFDVLDQKVRKANRAVGDMSKNVGNYKSAFSGLSSLMGAFGIGTGIYLAVDVAKNIYETTKQLQSLDLALRMVSETELEFAKNQQFVTEVADKWGLEIKSLQQTYTQFYTASKGLLTDNQIKETFEGIAKAGSVMGLSLEKQQAAFYAIDQMMSKGTVTAEELKKQLGNAMPGAIKAAAMAYMELHPAIKTIQEAEKGLYEDMKKGAIDSATYVPLIAKNFQILYGIEALESVHTMQSAQNRLLNSWTEWIRNTTQGGTGLKIIVSVIESLAENLSAIITTITVGATAWLAYKTAVMLANAQTKLLALTTTTATVATAEQTVVTGFQTTAQLANAEATVVATTATQRFNAAMKANILGLVVAGLAGLLYVYNKFTISVEDSNEAIKEKNNSLIANQEITKEVFYTTGELIKRYEYLSKKTNLTKTEQEELNEALEILSKRTPSAITATDAYGKALTLNIPTLKKYQENLRTIWNEKRRIAKIEEEDNIKNLEKQAKFYDKHVKNIKKYVGKGSVTQEMVNEYEAKKADMENQLIESKARLRALENGKKAESKDGKTDEVKNKTKERTIELIDKEIEVEQKKILQLSDTSGKEGLIIKKRIKQLNDERDAIYNNDKAKSKTEKDAAKEREQLLKEQYDAELSNLERQKELISDLKDAEETSFEDKIFLEQAYAYKQIQIAQFVHDEKVRLSKGSENLQQIALNELNTATENAKSESLDRINKITEKDLKDQDEKTKEWYKNNPPFFVENEDSKKAREETVKLNQKALEDVKNYIASFQIELGHNLGFNETADFFLKMDEDGRTMFDKLNEMADDSKEKQIATFQAIAESAQEMFNFIASASQANFEEEYSRLEKQKEVAIAFAGDSDSAKKKIEEDYEKRRKEIEKKEFKSKQKLAMVNIAIDTAQAVMAVSAKAKWWQVPLMIALGAAQLAIVASQKVPEYWKGTDNAEAGLAWTQERGAEIVTDKSGHIKDFGSDKGAKLTMMEKGDKVYNAEQTKKLMFNNELNSIMMDNGIGNAPQIVVNSGITKAEIEEVMMKTLGAMPQESTIIDANGFKRVISNGHSKTITNNNRVSGKGIRV